MIIALVILGGIVSILCYMLWDLKGNFERHRLQTIDSLYDFKTRLSHINSEIKMHDKMIYDAHSSIIKYGDLNIKHEGATNDAINQIFFRLNNPPLYNKGDKVDREWIVTAVDLVSHPKLQYKYLATNIKTGETKTWAE